MTPRRAHFAILCALAVLGISLVSGISAAQEPECKNVAHIGDSLTAYTKESLAKAYAAVGVSAKIDAYGGRAVLQRLPADARTGKQAARELVASGFKGCWVVA